MSIISIAAVAINPANHKTNVLGKDGKIPWNVPADRALFKRLTIGEGAGENVVVMGRKTWESIGKPLPGRENWVISHKVLSHASLLGFKCLTMKNAVQECLNQSHKERNVFIIGGAQIYQQLLPICDYQIITYINEIHEGDVFYPDFSLSKKWEKLCSFPLKCSTSSAVCEFHKKRPVILDSPSIQHLLLGLPS